VTQPPRPGPGPGPGPVAVVGASLAGLNAAEALLEHPAVTGVTVFEAERGPSYDRPPLSKELLLGTWDAARCALPPLADPRLTRRGGVRVTGLDPAALVLSLADGRAERFPGGIVIATGTVPRVLPGSRLPGVHVLRTLDDALGLRADLAARPGARVVIAGGGFIGTEVAAACLLSGHRVTILEAQAVPFERLGAEVGAALVAPLLARGAELVTQAAVVALSGTGRVKGVLLEDGSMIPAEVVVLGLGVEPATDWLAGSGLAVGGGVHCDTTLSVASRVTAAGDVACWPNRRFGEFRRIEHWDNAIRQGRHAGQRLLADHGLAPVRDFETVPWVWSDQLGHKIQLVGSTLGFDQVTVVHGSLAGPEFVALYRRGDQLTAALAVNAPKLLTRYRRLLSHPVTWASALAGLDPPAGVPARAAG
jgi:3-phenylpropionate/trans-cinnamate dioxygenase ferredoxin reductase subunit